MGDSALHLAARAGNVALVQKIFADCDPELVAELTDHQNQDGETALYVSAEMGHVEVVCEILKVCDLHSAFLKAHNSFDAFHIAAKQGHLVVLQELLKAFPALAMTTNSVNATALYTAALHRHIGIVNLLLDTDPRLARIARNNGKTALHIAARLGNVEVVVLLLNKDPATVFRIDRKGQTAVHMASKGHNAEILLELLKPDVSVIHLEDNKGDRPLHVATRKGKTIIVQTLISIEEIDINAINGAGETAFAIAEKLGNEELVNILREAGGVTVEEQVNPPKSIKRFKQTHDVQSQIKQKRRTNMHFHTIRKSSQKLHTEAPVCALADAMFRLPAKLDELLISHVHMLPRGAEDEIPLIKQDLEEIMAILQEHDHPGRAEDRAMTSKCLTKEVRELSYDMEDSVDQYVHAVDTKRRIVPRRKKYKITCRRGKTTARLPEKLKWRIWMANKIREFSVRSQEALQRYSLFNHPGAHGISTSATSTRHDVCFGSWYPTPCGELVGIDGHLNTLEAWLGKDGEQQLKVVSVVGSGGVGKTTLSKELYRRIRGQFECQAFVRTSRKPDIRRLLISLLSQVRPHQTPHTWKLHSLIADIRTHLHDKRYLIVIDDVWATQTWDIINRALPAGNLCSRILITTEVEDVALKCCGYDSRHVLMVKPLGYDDSSKLFFSTAFGLQYECPPELCDAAHNIVRKCAGSPLAMVTVASLLVSQIGKPEKWDYVNEIFGHGLSTYPSSEGMKQVLNLSYNNLPHYLKACVMYLSIYEEDYIIQKDDLVKQWIAEGLILATEEKDKEEISRRYFDELISSRMILPVYTNDNDDVLSCTLHHMVLDFIKHKSLEENFVIAIDHSQTTAPLADKVRRLSLHFGNAEATPPTNMRLSQVRTLAFFGVIECLPSVIEFRLLQVLILHLFGDDESVSFDLTGISELFRLRYLHVTCNATLEVPQTQMRGLQYLETLKIDARVSAVPSDIVHLPSLLHLSLPVGTNLPNGIDHMTSLCTLEYFDINVNSMENVHSLGELTNLQDLRLTCSTVPSSYLKSKIDSMGSILANLSNLRSVTLKSSGILESEPYSMIISCDGLSSVSSPPALLQRFEWLPRICTFSSIPKWISHLNKLCILKIGLRELVSNDVAALRGLPALTVLSLYVRAKPAEKIVFTRAGFLVLKCFKFRCSVPWLEFEVDAMPNLLKLKLSFDAHGVDQHRTIPVGMVHLTGLKEISAKIWGAGANERRAAKSALIDAIKMHSGCPTSSIQCLDGMFSGKDDNNSGIQEEEHLTLQKQYNIKEEDSKKQHDLPKDYMDVAYKQTSSSNNHRKSKRITQVRMQVRVGSVQDNSALEDGFSWRKYGQKDIIGSMHPRAYFRCTHRHVKGCPVTKQVQRTSTDPLLFDVVYHGEHTCLDSVGSPATSCGHVAGVEVMSRSRPGVGFVSQSQAACSSQVMSSEVVSGSGSTAGLWGDEIDMPDPDRDDTGISADYLDGYELDVSAFFA
ncbi:disease resistance protein RGA5-like [Triticum dicoccoides]|uniref:disease resistance protein RGA5-like n=1 Tax=Triticum dicoccoides TaxID=85692 RepID=UPI000E797802|nr:disease resistance protein RGA5-like [Triticum dicoccoides]